MTRYLIITVLVVALLGGGYYFFSNDKNPIQDFAPTGKQTGEFSLDSDNVKSAEPSQIVELKNGDSFDLTAGVIKKEINGKVVKMLGYNGSIPGPTIKIQKGSEITVNFKNEADVATTIHPHGVRVENKFDGVVDVTQPVVNSGETFTYKFRFPDEGVYWYHPHFREDYAQELGLYGNFLVAPTDENYYSPVNRELNLFLDDILVDGSGQIVPFNKDVANRTLMGRFGNVMLTNGETNYQTNVDAGEVVRFYLTNAASARTFNVAIPNAKIKKVGSDNGKYEKEEFVDEVLLSPSERAIFEVLFESPGKYELISKTPQKSYTLGIINVSNDQTATSYKSEFNTLRTNQDVLALIDPLRNQFSKPTDKKLSLALDMMGNSLGGQNMGGEHMMMGGGMMGNSQMGMTDGTVQKIEWEDDMGEMNVMSNSNMMKWKLVDTATNKSNMDIGWQFKKGDKVKIALFNDQKSQHPMQHPIHLHGQKFLVLSTNGIQNTNLVFKDTVLVQTGDTVEILVDMENPGDWMIHCHISEHLEGGMMTQFKVD